MLLDADAPFVAHHDERKIGIIKDNHFVVLPGSLDRFQFQPMPSGA
jgi:hypothetical protein